MNESRETPPTPVSLAAKQVGDVRARWAWTEPAVWTDRMLAALEQGVKGGVWFSLIDKVSSARNLEAAFAQVARNDGAAGVDHVKVAHFERQLPEHLQKLSREISAGTYRPQAIRRVDIPKPGTNETRPLGIPTVRDRIVQAAMVNAIEPIFERDFAEHSYGFRPGRGCKDALRRVDGLLQEGYVHVVDADLKGYFDSIPHDRLMELLQQKIADGPLLKLIAAFLKADILEGITPWTPQSGAPQGAVLSPLLSNVYLDPLDHLAARTGYQMVRYADDFVICCRTAEEAQAALELVRLWVDAAGLTLHPEKTRIVDVHSEGFDFLGYHFSGVRGDISHWVSRKSLRRLKDTLRAKMPPTSGRSLECVIADLNRTLGGWLAYFQHSRPWFFREIDQFVRRRLRSILRRRSGRRGCSRSGMDNRRWPNTYFYQHGLLNLTQAHAVKCQSSQR